jgi:hypothetical protein
MRSCGNRFIVGYPHDLKGIKVLDSLSNLLYNGTMLMNKVAIRVLTRVLDTLVEQTEEVRYAHKNHRLAYDTLDNVRRSLRDAKNALNTLAESAD